jgi:chorismate-pyruvate lyase
MKTAMQDHIEWLKATLEICKENASSLINCLELCLKDAESKLEMEKQQIMKARQDIFHTGNLTNEEYYNETFKSE